MKYRLINLETKEEHLCEKVILDGFDYYVSDEKPSPCNPTNVCMAHITKPCDKCGKYQGRILIATNNSNLDISKIVDEVEELADNAVENHPGNRTLNKDSWMSTGFVYGYNKAKETYKFTEEDMLNFALYLSSQMEENGLILNPNYIKDKILFVTSTELFHLWKEQQPITLYYK